MNYDEMHWKQIEKLVKERGGEYTTKEAALVWLAEFDAAQGGAPDHANADASNADTSAPAEVVFDKRLPYGEINGRIEGFPGAKYTQGGAFFTSQGKRIV